MLYLSYVIWCFEAISRLRVNLSKGRIFGVGNVGNMDCLAASLGCSVGSLPTTYFGLPLRASHKNSAIWNPVVSRIQKRLAGWKGSFLSKGGRLVLLKSVLASQVFLLTFYLSQPFLLQWRRKLNDVKRNFCRARGLKVTSCI